jgi:hypothetical protein
LSWAPVSLSKIVVQLSALYACSMLSRSLCLLGLAACGARTAQPVDDDEIVAPSMLFVESDEACGVEVDVDDAALLLTPGESGEDVEVVEIWFQDECTGLGGQHILMRSTDGQREMWLGAHGCRFFDDALRSEEPRHGLARVSFTAALFSIEEGVCIAFPDSAEAPSSSVKVRTVAVFDSQEEAERFANSLE